MKEALVLACECGATAKCSDLDGVTILAVERVWRGIHGEHQQVSCADAATIRDAELKRRAKMRSWYDGKDPESAS